MKPEGAQDGRYAIRSVQRAIAILTSFDPDHPEWSIAELAEHLDLHKSTVHRLVMVLLNSGLLEKNPSTRKYRLSLKMFELGSLVMARMDLRREALPYLKKLSDLYGETVHLVVRDYNEAIYIEKVEQPNAIVSYSRIGKRLPLYCTAVGKVLLAGLTDREVQAIIRPSDLVARTPNTITSIENLLQELAAVRARGYAVDNEELEEGLKCIAAPVRDHAGQVVAAISISGSPARLQGERLREMAEAVKGTALAVSQKLGYRGD